MERVFATVKEPTITILQTRVQYAESFRKIYTGIMFTMKQITLRLNEDTKKMTPVDLFVSCR